MPPAPVPDTPRPTATHVLAGVALTLGLLGFGLAVTGTSISALAPAPSPGPVPHLPGSSVVEERVVLDGVPARARTCHVPDVGPRAVLARYEALARRDLAPGTPLLVHQDGQGGGWLVWIGPEGAHRAVHAAADPRGGTAYRLIDGPPRGSAPLPDEQRPSPLPAPDGARPLFSLGRPDGTGTALFQASGAARPVAARFVAALAAQGYAVDAQAARFLDEAAASAPDLPLTVPFQRGDRAGVLVVTPDEGGCRVSLAIRGA